MNIWELKGYSVYFLVFLVRVLVHLLKMFRDCFKIVQDYFVVSFEVVKWAFCWLIREYFVFVQKFRNRRINIFLNIQLHLKFRKFPSRFRITLNKIRNILRFLINRPLLRCNPIHIPYTPITPIFQQRINRFQTMI